MKHQRLIAFALCAPLLATAAAQGWDDASRPDGLGLEVAAEGAFGSGDFTPYYLTANRHGILSTKANTGYMRAAAEWSKALRRTHLAAVADVQLQTDDYSTFYLQQLALDASWRYVRLTAGAWEVPPLLRDVRLSSGSTVWSGNARPIPQAQLATYGFLTIPGTHGWLQVYFDGSYGRYTDDGYLQKRHDDFIHYWQQRGLNKTGAPFAFMTDGIWHHHKQIYFRSNPAKPWSVTIGMEHAVQFGGRTVNNPATEYVETDYDLHFKDFLKVLIPTSGDGSDNVGDQNFAYGSHVGNLNAMLMWHDDVHTLSVYLENLFEDGSGMAKRNGWDGLWGLEWKTTACPWVDGVVVEYLQTTDQSGPIHWAPADFSQDIQSQLPNQARGADDYYNNYFFCGYAHHGQAIGTPMLKSPAYNADGYLRFTDTRVRAWHLGLSGHNPRREGERHTIGYRLLTSYRDTYGTPFIPSNHVNHAFNLLGEVCYQPTAQWSLTLSYAMDRGSLYGDNTAIGLKTAYRIKP